MRDKKLELKLLNFSFCSPRLKKLLAGREELQRAGQVQQGTSAHFQEGSSRNRTKLKLRSHGSRCS